MLRSIGCGMVAMVAITAAASADVITQSAIYTRSDGYSGEAFFAFNDFSAQLGTLTDVSIAISYNTLDSYWLQSNTAGAATAVFNPRVSLIAAGTGPPLPSLQPITQNLFFDPAPWPGPNTHTTVSITGNATIHANPANFYAFGSPADVMDLQMYAQIAPGQDFYEVGTDSGHSFSTGGSIAITYTYDPIATAQLFSAAADDPPAPIPEPASIVLLLMAAFGTRMVRKHDRS